MKYHRILKETINNEVIAIQIMQYYKLKEAELIDYILYYIYSFMKEQPVYIYLSQIVLNTDYKMFV